MVPKAEGSHAGHCHAKEHGGGEAALGGGWGGAEAAALCVCIGAHRQDVAQAPPCTVLQGAHAGGAVDKERQPLGVLPVAAGGGAAATGHTPAAVLPAGTREHGAAGASCRCSTRPRSAGWEGSLAECRLLQTEREHGTLPVPCVSDGSTRCQDEGVGA